MHTHINTHNTIPVEAEHCALPDSEIGYGGRARCGGKQDITGETRTGRAEFLDGEIRIPSCYPPYPHLLYPTLSYPTLRVPTPPYPTLSYSSVLFPLCPSPGIHSRPGDLSQGVVLTHIDTQTHGHIDT